jgi:hypothetical protein
MPKEPQDLTVGDESTVIGLVKGTVGNRSTVVGATDSRGNTVLNEPMAVGYGAQAGPGSIAIGAYAGAGGSHFVPLVTELSLIQAAMRQHPEAANHQEAIEAVGAAVEAAKKKDEASVMRNLTAAGQWALSFATATGSAFLADLLKKAAGM